ncbi:hypothetical protein IWW56_002736 [Coemansia sp. RSA 2131]|nr:hypothetical protein IWW56_002736 [Coemansia sp. RSA 2131]
MQLEICRFVRAFENLPRVDGQTKNGELAHMHALQASRSLAVGNLKAVVDSIDEDKISTAMYVLKFLSKEYERALTMFESAHAKYMSAHNAYTLHVEAAADRVEQLLIREDERAATVATAKPVSALTCLTLLEGLPSIHVHPDAMPDIHAGPVRGLSDTDATCDADITYCIQDFQVQALYQHSELQRVQIPLRPAVQGKTEKHPRYLDREEDLSTFFGPEILKPVQVIVGKLNPGVLVREQVGSATDHADYFIVVTVEVGGVSRRSAIPVKFKMPYGLAKVLKPRSLVDAAKDNVSAIDYQMRMAGLPTLEYGRLAIGQQLREYVCVRDIADHAPADIAGCLNREYGILTDYNQTWVVQYKKVFAPFSANRDNRNIDDRTENLEINVSKRFVVRNAIPHMAFVYAYVLSKVVKDIRANPNAYSRAPVDIHR